MEHETACNGDCRRCYRVVPTTLGLSSSHSIIAIAPLFMDQHLLRPQAQMVVQKVHVWKSQIPKWKVQMVKTRKDENRNFGEDRWVSVRLVKNFYWQEIEGWYVTSWTSILFLMLTVCLCRCKEWSFKGSKMYLPLILPISNYHSLVFQKNSRRYLRNLWTLSVTYNRTMPRRASVTNFAAARRKKTP